MRRRPPCEFLPVFEFNSLYLNSMVDFVDCSAHLRMTQQVCLCCSRSVLDLEEIHNDYRDVDFAESGWRGRRKMECVFYANTVSDDPQVSSFAAATVPLLISGRTGWAPLHQN